MPFIKNWIHLIFSTKNRCKLISAELKPKLIDHIRNNAESKNIYIDFINCVPDHIHILLSLKADQSLSKVVQLIKGESSFWINRNKLTPEKFEWQEEYIAHSVSESNVPTLRTYIKNQEQHHKKKTFAEEYNEFIKKFKFDKLGG